MVHWSAAQNEERSSSRELTGDQVRVLYIGLNRISFAHISEETFSTVVVIRGRKRVLECKALLAGRSRQIYWAMMQSICSVRRIRSRRRTGGKFSRRANRLAGAVGALTKSADQRR